MAAVSVCLLLKLCCRGFGARRNADHALADGASAASVLAGGLVKRLLCGDRTPSMAARERMVALESSRPGSFASLMGLWGPEPSIASGSRLSPSCSEKEKPMGTHDP